MQVKDLHDIALEGENSFTARFPHAFLVLVEAPEEGEEIDDFYTTQNSGEEMQNLVEIASGLRLDNEAHVYPVVRHENRSNKAGMITIGRTENCDIRLPLSGVSKFHCYFSQNTSIPNQHRISDGGSSNGTKLGDKKLAPNQPVEIQAGETIRLGDKVALRFFPSRDMWRMVKKSIP